MDNKEIKNEIVMYQSEDGIISVDVSLENETVWLTQKQMGELFDKSVKTINEHIKNIFDDGELNENSVIRNFRITASDRKKYDTMFYSLDVIISVGYRVKSKRGTQFRIWATNLLKQHLIKGYTINEKRLSEQTQKLSDLQNTIKILERTIENQVKELDEAKGLLKVISDYSYALTILDEYDHQDVKMRDNTKKKRIY